MACAAEYISEQCSRLGNNTRPRVGGSKCRFTPQHHLLRRNLTSQTCVYHGLHNEALILAPIFSTKPRRPDGWPMTTTRARVAPAQTDGNRPALPEVSDP